MFTYARLTLDEAIEKEWWLTNGLGGFSSGTLAGCNTRRYHGLLVASLDQGARRLYWSKLDVTALCDGRLFALSTNEFLDGTFYPDGYRHLLSAQVDPGYLQRTFFASGLIIEETITMVPGTNATIVNYRVVSAPADVELTLDPLVNDRDYHGATQDKLEFAVSHSGAECVVKAAESSPCLRLVASRGDFVPEPDWYANFFYRWEEYRGLSKWENHFRPGRFRTLLAPGQSIQIVGEVVGTNSRFASVPEVSEILSQHRQKRETFHQHLEAFWRRRKIVRSQVNRIDSSLWDHLLSLADATRAFIVTTSNRQDIIAGYPWFTQWGRDTMISLPGVCLVTGEYETARNILLSYAQHIRNGLLPNRFEDRGGASYNTVDASLWFVVATYLYLQATDDHQLLERIWPAVSETIRYYLAGTDFGIHTDSTGLLFAGSPGTQLTWMDAKVGDWVVTPRRGYPVEINALWYNTLQIGSLLGSQVGRSDLAFRWGETADLLQQTFVREYWNPDQSCLYDLIDADGRKDPSIRPNQLLSVSLPFPIISKERSIQVVRQVYEHLYTPCGLRTLSPSDPDYHPRFAGGPVERDSAYHQGTAWPWLTGQFIKAFVKVSDWSKESAFTAKNLLDPLVASLSQNGIGFISEISEPEYPFEARGCPAQAWSVAELLRAYIEDVLPPLSSD